MLALASASGIATTLLWVIVALVLLGVLVMVVKWLLAHL